MKFTCMVFIILIVASASLAAETKTMPLTGQRKLADGGTLIIEASEIDALGRTTSKVILRGKAKVKMFDKSGCETFNAQADKITVAMLTDKDGKMMGKSGISTIDLTGSPKMIFVSREITTGNTTKTTASSNSATYNAIAQMAYLTGNVKITNENPELTEGPAIITGDECEINLKPNLGPDEIMFRIKSSPGVSRIEATPKEEKPKK